MFMQFINVVYNHNYTTVGEGARGTRLRYLIKSQHYFCLKNYSKHLSLILEFVKVLEESEKISISQIKGFLKKVKVAAKNKTFHSKTFKKLIYLG